MRVPDEVSYGVLISGGLDSAIVQAVARTDKGYCCTFPGEGIDCIPNAQAAACGAEIVPVTFDLDETMRAFPKAVYHLDTPATWSALGHWFMAERMKADGVKVVLSGEGADELFSGYSRYKALWWLQESRNDPTLIDYHPTLDLLLGPPQEPLVKLLDRSPGGVGRDHAMALIERFSLGKDLVADMARVEWHTTMQCLLRMADKMTAAHSIENRGPFLDYRLIELAWRMPTRVKMHGGVPKAVLREVASRLGVPDSITQETCKRGLVVPWNRWRQATGERGKWDRADFRQAMHTTWVEVFDLKKLPLNLESVA
jgi:asparagine synthase (glutamine-hydrolysing)